MEKLLAGEENVPEPESDVAERREMDEEVLFEQAENLYQFDKDGNIIYDATEDEDDDMASALDDTDMNYILFRSEGKIYKAWKMVNNIVLDVDGLNMDDIDKVIAECWKYRDPDGFYNMFLSMSGKMINMKFKVEDLNLDAISELILKLERTVA